MVRFRRGYLEASDGAGRLVLALSTELLKSGADVERIVADRRLAIDERARLSILADLIAVKWDVQFQPDRVLLQPPAAYTKEVIRQSMSAKRQEVIAANRPWIDAHLDLARANLASATEALESPLEPVLEVVESEQERALFRMYRYSWSSPATEYVGRRIRLLVRDAALPQRPVIGIAALGSSIIHVPDRDAYIGWSTRERTDNIVRTMDAYVVGAVPPYNMLLGGKLIAMILSSNEVREIYRCKYEAAVTGIRRRRESILAALFTTSLYGASSQYNRIRYRDEPLWQTIGFTKGYGSLHLSERTFSILCDLLRAQGQLPSHRFGDGPNWRVRVIREAARMLGVDSDFLLRHSFSRGIRFTPMASNWPELLHGRSSQADYVDRPLSSLTASWRTRWLEMRKGNREVVAAVRCWDPRRFVI